MKKIAIDGPSGAGKSTISKRIAKRLGFLYIDTGAMYRACGLKCLQNGVSAKETPERAAALVESVSIELQAGAGDTQSVFLDGEDVTGQIRTPEVSMEASAVSAIPAVRVRLVALQREMAKAHDVIMDGRDIGTHVLPDADVKIFLTASAEDRAQRRYEELKEKGASVDYASVLSDMIQRDRDDSTRAASPLRPADDAVIVDTTGNTLDQSIDVIYCTIAERLGLA